MKRVDLSSLLAIAFVAALAITAFLFQDRLMGFTRYTLEAGWLKIVILIFVIVIVLAHAIKVRPSNDSSSVMIRSGLVPLDVFLTLGTYTAVTTTACSLLEGAFIQRFFGIRYFAKFGDLDVNVLLGVAALLLWYVIFHMYQMSAELVFKTEEVTKSSKEGKHSMHTSTDKVSD